MNGPCIEIDYSNFVNLRYQDNGSYYYGGDAYLKDYAPKLMDKDVFCDINGHGAKEGHLIPNSNNLIYVSQAEYNTRGDVKYWITLVNLIENKIVFNFGDFKNSIPGIPAFSGFSKDNKFSFFQIGTNQYIKCSLQNGLHEFISTLPDEITQNILFKENVKSRKYKNYQSSDSYKKYKMLNDSSYIKSFSIKSKTNSEITSLVKFNKKHEIVFSKDFENISIWDFDVDSFSNRIALSYRTIDSTYLSYLDLNTFELISNVFVKQNSEINKYVNSPGDVHFSKTGKFLYYSRDRRGTSIYLNNDLYYGFIGDLYYENENIVISNNYDKMMSFDLINKSLIWNCPVGDDYLNSHFYIVNENCYLISGRVLSRDGIKPKENGIILYKFPIPETIINNDFTPIARGLKEKLTSEEGGKAKKIIEFLTNYNKKLSNRNDVVKRLEKYRTFTEKRNEEYYRKLVSQNHTLISVNLKYIDDESNKILIECFGRNILMHELDKGTFTPSVNFNFNSAYCFISNDESNFEPNKKNLKTFGVIGKGNSSSENDFVSSRFPFENKRKKFAKLIYKLKKKHPEIVVNEKDNSIWASKITGLDQEYFILKEKKIELDGEIVECEKFILKLGDYSFISLDKNGFGCLINQSIPQNPPLLFGYWENNFISLNKIKSIYLYNNLPNYTILNYERNQMIEIKDNNIYLGECNNNNPNGNGWKIFKNGNEFAGNFSEGKETFGTLKMKNGDIYVGSFSNSLKNGQGDYTWYDGSKYIGEFSNNQRNGYGKLVDKEGYVSEGIWQDDVLIKNKETIAQENREAEERRVAEERKRQENEKQKQINKQNEDLADILVFRMMMGELDKTYKKLGGKHVPICEKCKKQFKKDNGWSCDGETAIRGENLGSSALQSILTNAPTFPTYCSLECARKDGKCW